MSLGAIRRRVLGALKNFISELSMDGDTCVKQYVPFTPTESVSLEHSTTILVLLAVIAFLLIVVLVLVITLVRYGNPNLLRIYDFYFTTKILFIESAYKQNRASQLMLQQMEKMAKGLAENNNNNQSASGGEESLCSLESTCECCQEKKLPAIREASEDSNFDANEGTFVNVLDEMIITDELEQLINSASQFKDPQDKESFSLTNGHDENDEESDVSVEDN